MTPADASGLVAFNAPAEKALRQAYAAACAAEPRRSSWGFFSCSDAPPAVPGSGLGGFVWFRTKGEMIEFVRLYHAWWHPAPGGREPGEIAAQVHRILHGVDGKTRDLEPVRQGLNTQMRHLWQIRWWGTFRELCESWTRFPVAVRAAFFSRLRDKPRQAQTPPIAGKDVPGFLYFVAECGH